MPTWFFAGVNRLDRLPPEFRSRFVTFDLGPGPLRRRAGGPPIPNTSASHSGGRALRQLVGILATDSNANK